VADGFIATTPGSGANVETKLLTRTQDNVAVNRETVALGDPNNIGEFAEVHAMFRYPRQMDEIRTAMQRDMLAMAALGSRFCARMPGDARGRYDRGYR
jgi:hypothetical protein